MNASVRKVETNEPSPGWVGAGMTQAVEPDVRFDNQWDEMPGSRVVTGLDPADQRILASWLNHSSTNRIDTILDLTIRPWNIVGASAILGVFEVKRNHASWLIVKLDSGWTLARCADGFISDVSASLPDILSIIYAEMTRHS